VSKRGHISKIKAEKGIKLPGLKAKKTEKLKKLNRITLFQKIMGLFKAFYYKYGGL
jgi:hypothetical protein